MTPEAFEKQMASAVFTHRSDAASVVQLQAKIFYQKVSACEDLLLEGLKASEFAKLAPALKHYRCLRSLRLKKFNVGAEEATAFAQALLGPGGVVQKLEIWCNVPEASAREMLQALATGLQTNSTVHTLIIRDFTESLATTSVRALSQGLRVNTAITKLVLRGRIGNAGAEAIAVALMTNQSITHVDLRQNGIGRHGAAAIAETLKHNSTVAIMDLGDNSVKEQGACALAAGLKNNHVVIDLNINCDWWELSDVPRALSEIERLLERNREENGVAARPGSHIWHYQADQAADEQLPEKLDCKAYKLGLEWAVWILHINTALTSVDLIRPFPYMTIVEILEDTGAAAIVEALRVNGTVTHLSLAQNDLGDAGAVALAKALVVYRVTHVNVNGNSIGDEGAEAFANALRANTTLTVRSHSGSWILKKRFIGNL
ncbi:Protein NLRC3 [Symbiodinium microadriaticum]|uniref:Protein NLRC3 n=1 Tax=Symbiodinium microadriaticum TaxID=2951 RepID=A0A1Q9EA36_SYMMI|nr:Protein NLRC3 [Symbiodinium microadriaticum]